MSGFRIPSKVDVRNYLDVPDTHNIGVKPQSNVCIRSHYGSLRGLVRVKCVGAEGEGIMCTTVGLSALNHVKMPFQYSVIFKTRSPKSLKH